VDKKLEEEILYLLENKYKESISKAIQQGANSFTIDFNDLSKDSRVLLNKEYMKIMEEDFNLNKLITDAFNRLLGTNEFKNVTLQFVGVTPRKQIRELTSDLINGLILVNGVIISTSSPQSIITKAHFVCPRCNDVIVVPQTSSSLIPPSECKCRNKRGFILLEAESEWDDYQENTIQEKPDEMKAGVIPRTIKIICRGRQLIDKCKPGDIVDIVCAMFPYKNKGLQTKVYTQCLNVNNIDVLSKEAYSIIIDEEDVAVLENISTNPDLQTMVTRSIFPSIYEHDDEKLGMSLAMFGGVDRKKSDISQRGTINIILIGDPSTAKTRMLQAVSNAAPKAIYTSGMGASGIGLTAAAVQDANGWRLEAGALVLADGGICCIDEIEKMNDEDRVKIHEAMSKQTISIDKATIHTTLNSRTSVIAAANPTHGRYNDNEYLTDNISLPPTILSRFDLIFIIRDIADETKDTEMAQTIFGVRDIENQKGILDTELLKKYILYAKRLQPKLPEDVIKRILDFYVPLRKQSQTIENNPIAIAPRQLEGLRRLIEARARMFLREVATVEDADVVIDLMSRTLARAGYDPATGKSDIMIVEAGKPVSRENKRVMIEKIMQGQIEPISTEQVNDMLESNGLYLERGELNRLLDDLYRIGTLYKPVNHLWGLLSKQHLFKSYQKVYSRDDDGEQK
jgi:replicative DNA helicase Mcm